MSRRAVVVCMACILASGCGCPYPRWLLYPFGTPAAAPAMPAVPAPAPPAASAPVIATPPEPAKPPPTAPKPAAAGPAEPPKRVEPKPPATSVEPVPNDRAKKIASARADIQTGMTALELRAVTVCASLGAACVENRGLMKSARDLDTRLAAALLDPQIAIDWAEVTTVLNAVVDRAMKGAK